MTFKIDIENGKYTFINDNGIVSILRGGETWRNETGDKALLCLLQKMETIKEKLNKCENLLSEAHDLMDDVHCYDTEIYHEISRYFNGE